MIKNKTLAIGLSLFTCLGASAWAASAERDVLNLSSKGISTLADIENIEAIEVLSLQNNQISDLTFLLSLPSLEAVTLDGNAVDLKSPCTRAVIAELERRGVFVDCPEAAQRVTENSNEAISVEYASEYKQGWMNSIYDWNGMWFMDTRDWYHDRTSVIKDLLDPNESLEDQARDAFRFRQQIRRQARELMGNRMMAWALNTFESREMTFEQLLERKMAKGLSEDDAYLSIIESASHSNDQYDMLMEYSKKLINPLRGKKSA